MSNILIVDDEKSIRITLSEFLKKEGHQVSSASDVDEAIQLFNEQNFDIVVTDIIMPKRSGTELLKYIREHSQSVQVILMTGEPTVDTAIQSVQSGANDYLTKPIQKDIFLQTIRQVAETKQLWDEKQFWEEQNVLYQKKLEQTVENRTMALQNAMLGMITLIHSIVDIRDPYTCRHQIRVGNLAADLAKKMTAKKETVDLVRIIGYIHDIGKLAVPTEILAKPGKLSELEMQLIREHPQTGYEMLTGIHLPAAIAEVIRQHHERLDGSGYPLHLKEEQILWEAKLIAVADVVESIASHRPYRPALGIDRALEELKINQSHLYDKEICNSCIELFEKDGYELDDEQREVYFYL